MVLGRTYVLGQKDKRTNILDKYSGQKIIAKGQICRHEGQIFWTKGQKIKGTLEWVLGRTYVLVGRGEVGMGRGCLVCRPGE